MIVFESLTSKTLEIQRSNLEILSMLLSSKTDCLIRTFPKNDQISFFKSGSCFIQKTQKPTKYRSLCGFGV